VVAGLDGFALRGLTGEQAHPAHTGSRQGIEEWHAVGWQQALLKSKATGELSSNIHKF
jgi:hypothetical protein